MQKMTMVLMVCVCILILMSGCAKGPSESYKELVTKAEKKDWAGVYDSFSAKSQGAIDTWMEFAARLYAGFAEAEDAKKAEQIAKLKGKDLFVAMGALKGTSESAPFPLGEVTKESVSGDKATLTIKDKNGKEESVKMEKENKQWRLVVDLTPSPEKPVATATSDGVGTKNSTDLLSAISGVWRARSDGAIFTINYAYNRFMFAAKETVIPVTLGQIDKEHNTVNLKVTTKDGKLVIWTIRHITGRDNNHLVFTLHDGTQDEFTFVRKISPDDLNMFASVQRQKEPSQETQKGRSVDACLDRKIADIRKEFGKDYPIKSDVLDELTAECKKEAK